VKLRTVIGQSTKLRVKLRTVISWQWVKLRTVISWQRLNLSTLNATTPAEFQRGWRVDGDIAEIVTRSVRIFLVSAHTAPPTALVRVVC